MYLSSKLNCFYSLPKMPLPLSSRAQRGTVRHLFGWNEYPERSEGSQRLKFKYPVSIINLFVQWFIIILPKPFVYFVLLCDRKFLLETQRTQSIVIMTPQDGFFPQSFTFPIHSLLYEYKYFFLFLLSPYFNQCSCPACYGNRWQKNAWWMDWSGYKA